jgi:hypothetical protein
VPLGVVMSRLRIEPLDDATLEDGAPSGR